MSTQVIKKKLSAAYRYSYCRMALNYYMLNEIAAEEPGFSARQKEYTEEFHGILKAFLEGDMQADRLSGLRGQVISVMECLTAYTDCFQIYEYILNRMERRFQDGFPVQDSINEFTARLVEFVMSAKDMAVMNERLSRVIGQLPVRYTRQKFYGLLTDGMSAYIGSGKSSLEGMLYRLRTESMALLPEEQMKEYEELYEIRNQLHKADYLHMTKEEFQKNTDLITIVSEKLFAESGVYMILEELINDLYVLLLSEPSAVIDASEKQVLENLVTSVLKRFLEGNTSAMDDDITELLCDLEGMQESAMERYLSYPETEPAGGDGKLLQADRLVGLLLSGSPFVPLNEEEDTDDPEPVDRQWLETKMAELHKELDGVFEHASKPVVRAVMAKLLSSIPMHFSSVDEIRAYIAGSLESCGDLAEREASMELLEQEMVDEDALV